MPELIVFDLDNTLTESRTPILPKTASLLRELLKQTRVAVISGAAFWQFEKELLEPLGASDWELANLYILTTSGAELWTYKNCWQRIYAEKISKKDKNRVRAAFRSVLGLDEKALKPLMDDRDSGMTYSALGRDTPADLKHLWDPDQKKRAALVEKLSPMLAGLELKIGGTTSIDVTNAGIDKAFGVRKIVEYAKVPASQTVFVGDALFAEGNDAPVLRVGVKIMETDGPESTQKIMDSFLQASEEMEAGSINFEKPPVAFFCAEYALDDDSLTYAGGLGVLAADFIYETRDAGFPMIFVGLWHSDKKNGERQNRYSIVTKEDKPLVVEIPFENKTIKVGAHARCFGRNTWLILLDTDIRENDEQSRKILSTIYSLDPYTWMRQDLVLGAGGARMLKAMGILPKIYHLNEGHSAFAALEMVADCAANSKDKDVSKALDDVRRKTVATKHTIFSQAGLKIEQGDFLRYFGPYCRTLGISAEKLFSLGTDPEVRVFSATHFLLNAALRANAVSVLHAKFEREVHPKSRLLSITNGIYRERWLCKKTKPVLREELVDYVNAKTGSSLNAGVCTVVWARRLVAYKRPELILSDLKRLERLCSGDRRLQFIISGNVYNNDQGGESALRRIRAMADDPAWRDKIAYMPDYSIPLAHKLVSGADVWLNTPFRGKEACGTSGMKAGLNGALEMSVSDGWIEEANWKNTGWILPEENTDKAVYDLLEREVAPLFYDRKEEWMRRAQKTKAIIEKNFTTERMLAEYIKKLYRL